MTNQATRTPACAVSRETLRRFFLLIVALCLVCGRGRAAEEAPFVRPPVPENETDAPPAGDSFREAMRKAAAGADADAAAAANEAAAEEKAEEERRFFLNWERGVDLETFIKFFCDILGLRYVLDSNVKGNQKIVVKMGDITHWSREERAALFDALLSMEGLKRRKVGDLWHIETLTTPSPGIPDAGIHNAADRAFPLGEAPVVGVLHFRNVPAAQAVGILNQFRSQHARIIAVPQMPFILILDTADNIRRLEELVRFIDVDPTVRKHYLLENANAEDVANELKQIFHGQLSPSGQPTNFIPVPRVNMVIAQNADPEQLPAIDRWIGMLDVRDRYERMETRVYRMKVEDADNVAKVLEGLYGKISALQKQRAGNKPGQPSAPTRPDEFSGEVIIIPDKNTNTILIHTTPANHRLIGQTIAELDRPRKQVLIEVVVADVTLDESTELGIEWTLRQDARGTRGQHVVGSKTGINSIGVGRDFSSTANGFNYLVTETDKLLGMLHAASSDSRLRVLSSPSILTSDNTEAEIAIGTEVPVETQTINNNVYSTSYQYKDAKIRLKVVPHINDDRVVTLDIRQEVKDILEANVEAPSFLTREITTSLTVADGQTLVIGGLIKRSESDGETGVPGLSKIPLVGGLFRKSNKQNRGTELVMILTPRVVMTRTEADDLTREFQDKVIGSLQRDALSDELGIKERPPAREIGRWPWNRPAPAEADVLPELLQHPAGTVDK